MQPPVRRFGFILAFLAVPILIAAAEPSSVDQSVPEPPATVEPQLDATEPAIAATPRSPLMSDIQTLYEAARVRVAELEARAAAAPNAMAFLELQRQIEQIHRDTELGILKLQADHARRAGDEETAQKIEAAIALAAAPPPVVEKAARPAPVEP